VIRSVDIAWLTGLLEGEGSFLMSERSIAITVSMTDRDVIDRAATLLGGRVYKRSESRAPRPRKPAWRAQVKGPRATGWMMTAYSFLGARRREQVRHAIAAWRAMRFVRTSALVERGIAAAFRAGVRNKCLLARQFGVSRPTVYAVLARCGLVDGQTFGEPTPITPIEIAWLARLFEGEGNISINGRSLTIRIKMTDKDVVVRAATLLSASLYERDPGGGLKRTWTAQLKGDAAAGWAMTLYSWLCVRRRGQVRSALAAWRTQRRGVLSKGLEAAIIEYRNAGWSQADIMRLFSVGKSTVYRHTKGRVRRRRCRPIRQELRSPQAASC
jgi:hypothetical protein